MEIYLIRHTTPLIQKGLIYGHLDVPLAETFEEEKETVLWQLPPVIDGVYSSPSIRCARLAAAISPAYQEDEALKELNFGDWEGKTWDTINRQDSDRWMNDFVHLSPPNGETMLQMEERILDFWNHVLQQPYQRVAVVTHGGVIRILLARHRSIQLKDAFTIPVALAEVIRLSV
ncbi:alpha-ribazole phosphatase [Pedobacter sp. L105]|uniref:alpha-ribazole phosphatase n=1 Tax=Pedobacter sp. L105 TaxID=1641871 RepID=UPI00131B5177|nr:alpha-ribazole phosphatase [Pedobacter sp. L105]